MKTKRIKIPKGSRAEIQISYPNPERADGKNSRGYTNLVIAGEASVAVVIEKEIGKKKATKGCDGSGVQRRV
jgi:hypothetical protein